MVENCGAQCSKFFLFVFNSLFFIGGACVLGIGIWVRVDGKDFLNLTRLSDFKSIEDLNNSTAFEQIGTILIIAGSIVLVISFLGCCGACKEWRPLLVIYALFLIVILGLEVGAGIYAGLESTKVKDKLIETLNETLHRHFENNKTLPFDKVWLASMKDLKCCGAYNYKDFDFLHSIPEECCNVSLSKSQVDSCYKKPSEDPSLLYQQGCGAALVDFLMSKLTIVIGVGVGIGLVQIFGIVFAFCLCSAISSELK